METFSAGVLPWFSNGIASETVPSSHIDDDTPGIAGMFSATDAFDALGLALGHTVVAAKADDPNSASSVTKTVLIEQICFMGLSSRRTG
jgi:hypothetical protein